MTYKATPTTAMVRTDCIVWMKLGIGTPLAKDGDETDYLRGRPTSRNTVCCDTVAVKPQGDAVVAPLQYRHAVHSNH